MKRPSVLSLNWLPFGLSLAWPSPRIGFVCKLNKSLYALKQAPCTWFLRFTSFLSRLGFQSSKSNSSLFVFHQGSCLVYLLLYVDDIILTGSSTTLLNQLITQLRSEFQMSDLGPLQRFLGVSVHRSNVGLFLSQDQYATHLLTLPICSNAILASHQPTPSPNHLSPMELHLLIQPNTMA
jgi:hypothetical protein